MNRVAGDGFLALTVPIVALLCVTLVAETISSEVAPSTTPSATAVRSAVSIAGASSRPPGKTRAASRPPEARHRTRFQTGVR